MKYYYKAFGMTIASEYVLPQVETDARHERVDVNICYSELTESDAPTETVLLTENTTAFTVEDVAHFRITEGKTIEVCPLTDDKMRLPIFLLGSCMGAIFHQRGLMPLHGSCVTDGKQTILITGDSGAGKSTLASVFLKHGWKFLTDDVALIIDPEGEAKVQPSYPSQKLWSDSPEMADKTESDVHTWYERGMKSKFGVFVRDSFLQIPMPLTKIVRLVAADIPTQVATVDSFAKVDQIMRNTYRDYMIPRSRLEQHFQECVSLSCKVQMLLAIRNSCEESREKLYSMITGNYQNNGLNEGGIKMDENTLLKRKDNMITADMQGSAVTMDVSTGQYYDLGETGGAIWNFLASEMTYGALIDIITNEYDVSREECEADVDVFLQKLINDGLVLIQAKK